MKAGADGHTQHLRPATVVADLWSDPDALMLIFAASSAEFAVNPINEWLFFTGKLPADPVGRFLGTIGYMRQLMLAPSQQEYEAACGRIRGVHSEVETRRGRKIPDDAYLDVLLMGMHHSVRALEVSRGRRVNAEEAAEFVASYRSMAHHMGVPGFPEDIEAYSRLRRSRLALYRTTEYTRKLYAAYRRALGPLAYWMLCKLSPAVVEPDIVPLAGLRRGLMSKFFEAVFPLLHRTGVHRLLMPPSVRRMHRGAQRIIEQTGGSS